MHAQSMVPVRPMPALRTRNNTSGSPGDDDIMHTLVYEESLSQPAGKLPGYLSAVDLSRFG